eukprot:SAG11_NODE_5739_length_1474_cov_1.315636_2_plen_138_part_00
MSVRHNVLLRFVQLFHFREHARRAFLRQRLLQPRPKHDMPTWTDANVSQRGRKVRKCVRGQPNRCTVPLGKTTDSTLAMASTDMVLLTRSAHSLRGSSASASNALTSRWPLSTSEWQGQQARATMREGKAEGQTSCS